MNNAGESPWSSPFREGANTDQFHTQINVWSQWWCVLPGKPQATVKVSNADWGPRRDSGRGEDRGKGELREPGTSQAGQGRGTLRTQEGFRQSGDLNFRKASLAGGSFQARSDTVITGDSDGKKEMSVRGAMGEGQDLELVVMAGGQG